MSQAITLLPLDSLHESPSNTRKRYDPVKLQELADSIKARGIMQPIVARPMAQSLHHEIVFGHRRYRASRLAGCDSVPAIIREMTDEEVAIEQLIENAQREDVNALEEAEGFRRLMDEFNLKAADIIKQTGKSKSHIYARLKLLQMTAEPRAALLDGTIDAEVAQVIARLPSSVQAQALSQVTFAEKDGKRVSVSSREAKARLANYLTDLTTAPFLLDVVGLNGKAPACTKCDRRSGNNPDMTDLGPNVCTSRECYTAKCVDQVGIRIKEAKAEGLTVLEGQEARDVLHHPSWPVTGYLRLDDQVHTVDGATLTARELLAQCGDKAPSPTLLAHPDAPERLIELVPQDALARARRIAAGQDPDAAPDPAATGATSEPEAPEIDTRPPEVQAVLVPAKWHLVREAIRNRVTLYERTADDLRLILLRELDLAGDFGSAEKVFGWSDFEDAESPSEARRAKLDTMTRDEMAAVLTMLAIDNVGGRYHDEGREAAFRLALAACYGVDALAVASQGGDEERDEAEVWPPLLGSDTPSPGCAAEEEGAQEKPAAKKVKKSTSAKASKATPVKGSDTPSPGCAAEEEGDAANEGAKAIEKAKKTSDKAPKGAKKQKDEAGFAGDLVDAMGAA